MCLAKDRDLHHVDLGRAANIPGGAILGGMTFQARLPNLSAAAVLAGDARHALSRAVYQAPAAGMFAVGGTLHCAARNNKVSARAAAARGRRAAGRCAYRALLSGRAPHTAPA